MTGLELERAVEALAATCDECRVLHAQLGSAHHDLQTAARRAARQRTVEHLAACRRARSDRDGLRGLVRNHLTDTHHMKEAKAS